MKPSPLSEVWRRTLDILESELSGPSFNTWFRSTRLVDQQKDTFVISVPNKFAKDWLETRYYNLIKDTLKLITGREEIELKFTLSEKNYKSSPASNHNVNNPAPQIQNNLNPKYTFDSFVIGNSNRFAHAASLAVAEAPARAYNPLFIYGGVGLGKTHLMHAIGQYINNYQHNHQVVYVSSETFTNELINAIRDDKTIRFRSKYRNVDTLLIDDIQFLAGKERTQEEFFHTFNSLHEANKQIIISSDRPPKEIPTLEDRLRSRFEWGLMTDIQPPDFETRIAILRKKAQLENMQIENEILHFIAEKIQYNIRELEGALIKVGAYTSLNNKALDEELIEEYLKDIISPVKTKQITLPIIQEAVARYFGIKVMEFKSKKRTRSIAFPRQIAMYLTRDLTNLSLPRIGEEFGGRDHSTVIHACGKIENSLHNDPSLRQIVLEIKNSL